MNQLLKGLLLATASIASLSTQAQPQTRLRFDSFLVGSDRGGRFGAEVACSRRVIAAGNNSIIAIAAPNALNGQGRVYLFDQVQSAVPKQVLTPAAEQATGRFGTAIQFIDDLNRDGVDDLIIGAPGLPTEAAGSVYLFTSAVSETGVGFVACGLAQGPQGFGERVQAVRATGGSSAVNVVIANPRLARIDGFAVSAQSDGSCQFAALSDFSETFAASSDGGSSISQVGGGSGLTKSFARLFISASRVGGLGTIYERMAADTGPQTPVISQYQLMEHNGTVVSGQPDSRKYVVGSPRSYSGRGLVAVYELDVANDQPQCILNNPHEEYSGMFGSHVQHLGSSFIGMFSSAQQVIALRSAESSTGGALGFVGVTETGCAGLIPANNCVNDAQQEQGLALTGGSDCQAFVNGSLQRMLVSGSPGWAAQRGRVDIAFEDGILDMTHSCADLGSVTLTQSASLSGIPSQQSVQGVSTITPIPTPIANGTTTARPAATITISVNATATALANNSTRDSNGHLALERTNLTSKSLLEDPPIVVAPGSGGLPVANVIVRQGEVQVELPRVRASLLSQQPSSILQHLQKQRRISKHKAKQLLSDQDNLVITYVVRYWEVADLPRLSSKRFAFIQSAHADDFSGNSKRVKQIKTRSNRITLRNLKPGALFGLAYSVEISTKRPMRRIGATRASDTVTFRAE